MSRRKLLPHQEEALAYARTRRAIALFLDMRLGKTPVAIRWAQERRCRKVLIIAPLSVLPGMQWEGELALEHAAPAYIWPYPHKAVWKSAARTHRIGWFAINYEAVRNDPDILRHRWDAIILDESTRIRNPKAQITKLLLNATAHIPHRAILSGLPNPEQSLDFFCQLKFLHGAFLGFTNYWAYRQSLYIQGYAGWEWIPKLKARARIKNAVHAECFIKSRKETGLGNRRIFERRYVEMNGRQRHMAKEILKTFAVDGLQTKWVPVQHLWLARLAGGFSPELEMVSTAKLALLASILDDERPREQVVVWFRFTAELKAASRLLKRRGIICRSIWGATPPAERSRIQKGFHAGRYRVLLIQEKVGQYGLNLSPASTAIYYSNVWDQEVRTQSQERIEHMKKRHPLLFIDLVTRGSVDESVLDALQEKRQESRSFLRMVMSKFVGGLRKVA